MAYSNYGGYAYRNGTRIKERSDAAITPDGDTFGVPGMWPGVFVPQKASSSKDWPYGHVVLGDGPIFVVLYKQSTIELFRGFEKLNPVDYLESEYHHMIDTFNDGERFVDCEDDDCVYNVDGYRVDYHHEWTDNSYQYVKLTQTDGVVWTGWSGYGVGAGFENSPYHNYSTDKCEARAKEIYPEAFEPF